ncbi:hypothetical protein B0H14DRAFT_2641886 [Mycena olivaceomarginata]|nr:hypothetical protein B0H14DRAFT_2641886 [Mycena olivaceomarginata]
MLYRDFSFNSCARVAPHGGDSARFISSSRARTSGTNSTSVSQKFGGRADGDAKRIIKAFRKLLDEDQEKHGKTEDPIDETAVDEFQQGSTTLSTLQPSTQRRRFKEERQKDTITECGTTAESQACCTASLQPSLAPCWRHSLLNVVLSLIDSCPPLSHAMSHTLTPTCPPPVGQLAKG